MDQLKFTTNTVDILIVDEADELILNDPVDFYKRTANCRSLCFSATSGKGDEYEGALIKRLGFTVQTYGQGNQRSDY